MNTTLSKIGMTPPHPGTFMREEILDELGLGLGVAEAARIPDIRPVTLSDLVNGKAALSAEMALRIEKAFGMDMETLLRMQAWYDAQAMRRRSGEIDVTRYEPPGFPGATLLTALRLAAAAAGLRSRANLS
nr:HigA family addiction module antitoxin [uncultured Rhodopila sp.]